MARARRGRVVARSTWLRPGAVVSGTNGRSVYEGRILIEQSPDLDVRVDSGSEPSPDRVDDGWPRPEAHPPPGLAPIASPGLVALAALALWEGYRQLHVIPSVQRHPSVYAFAVMAPVVAVVLTRHPGGGRRTPLQRSLVATAVLVGVFTPVALAVDGPVTATVLGVADMVSAALALSVVMAGEGMTSALRGKLRSRRR